MTVSEIGLKDQGEAEESEALMTSNITTTSNVGLLSEQPEWWDNLLPGDEHDKADKDQENRLRQNEKNVYY